VQQVQEVNEDGEGPVFPNEALIGLAEQIEDPVGGQIEIDGLHHADGQSGAAEVQRKLAERPFVAVPGKEPQPDDARFGGSGAADDQKDDPGPPIESSTFLSLSRLAFSTSIKS
jgi:hypothetical protein